MYLQIMKYLNHFLRNLCQRKLCNLLIYYEGFNAGETRFLKILRFVMIHILRLISVRQKF